MLLGGEGSLTGWEAANISSLFFLVVYIIFITYIFEILYKNCYKNSMIFM